MFRRSVAALLGLGLLALASTAAAGTPVQADRTLDRALRSLVAMPGGPPGVIAIVQRGGQTKVHSFGVGDTATRDAPSADDHMRLASTSKAFSGAAALSLVEKDRLSLDDTIGQRLPSLPKAWAAVTLRQLLNHTSGLPDYLSTQAAQEAIGASLTVAPPPAKLLDFVRDKPLEFAPGSQYKYSNSDNIAVGLMVAAVTGGTYEQALQSEVYGPLGLTQTSLPAGVQIPAPFIHGYDLPVSGPPEDLSEVLAAGWAWASGGMVSTPSEINSFIRGYVGRKLFGSATQAQQFQLEAGGGSEPPGPGRNSAGLGIFRYQTRCGTVFGHTGNFIGYTQFMAASRDGSRSATVSVNTQLRPDLDGKVFAALRRAELLAVCAALAG